MKPRVKSFEELPAMLKVEEVAAVMGISRTTAFNLTKAPGFPVIRVGLKRLVIPKDKFIHWIEQKVKEPLDNF